VASGRASLRKEKIHSGGGGDIKSFLALGQGSEAEESRTTQRIKPERQAVRAFETQHQSEWQSNGPGGTQNSGSPLNQKGKGPCTKKEGAWDPDSIRESRMALTDHQEKPTAAATHVCLLRTRKKKDADRGGKESLFRREYFTTG